MADLMQRPDDVIFAKEAQVGELTDFQNLARGWGSTVTFSQGIPPMEWFNFIGNRTDKGIHYILQQGIDSWIATENYPANALVKLAADNCVYKAKRANINKSPTGSGDDWVKVLDITEASAAARQVGKNVGNIVQVGAFGIGSTGEVATDANQITKSGIYDIPATAPGLPVSGRAATLIHQQYDANTATQYASPLGTRVLYIRNKVNGVWSVWEGQYGPSNKPTAPELGINQDYIPMSGSDQVHGNIGTSGWIHIARQTSDLFRATNSAGVAVSELVGNVAGGLATQQRLTSVSVAAGSANGLLAFWGSVCMGAVQFNLQSGGSTFTDFHVVRPGTIADRRVVGLRINGGNGVVSTENGFQLYEAGARVYSPNNPQPVDLTSVVRGVRLGAAYTQQASNHFSMPAGHMVTGLNGWKVTGPNFELDSLICRPVQINVNNQWFTVSQI